MSRALVGLALAAAFSQAWAAQPEPAKSAVNAPLGRLFFTPTERAQLDIARMQKKPPTEAAAPAPEPPPLPQTVTYGGIVRRSDGKAMLWINNRLVEEKEALSGLNLKGRVRPDGAVTLQVPQTGGSINVKVGQSVELQTGRIGETKRPETEAKPAADDAAAPAAEAKPGAAPAPQPAPAQPPAAGAKPPEPPGTERKPEAGGAVGLKLDRGGRALSPAEEQQVRGRNETR